MPSGLRAIASHFQEGSQEARRVASNLLRTSGDFRQPNKTMTLQKVLSFASTTAPEARWRRRGSTTLAATSSRRRAPALNGNLNPLVVEAMREVGIDISKKKTQAVFDVFKSGQLFTYVITVCDETSAEKCPIFPGPATRMHWSFSDPSALMGPHEEKLKGAKIRDEIRQRSKSGAKKSVHTQNETRRISPAGARLTN